MWGPAGVVSPLAQGASCAVASVGFAMRKTDVDRMAQGPDMSLSCLHWWSNLRGRTPIRERVMVTRYVLATHGAAEAGLFLRCPMSGWCELWRD